MARWRVWYTTELGRGDSVEVEAETKDKAADIVLDTYDNADTIDSVEQIA